MSLSMPNLPETACGSFGAKAWCPAVHLVPQQIHIGHLLHTVHEIALYWLHIISTLSYAHLRIDLLTDCSGWYLQLEDTHLREEPSNTVVVITDYHFNEDWKHRTDRNSIQIRWLGEYGGYFRSSPYHFVHQQLTVTGKWSSSKPQLDMKLLWIINYKSWATVL